ncbi:hypothetical protein ACFL07_11580 [Pseudomonadota bacterium]
MMAEQRDPILQGLFAEPVSEPVDEAFVGEVMNQTRNRMYWILVSISSIVVLIVLSAWLFSVPALKFVILITESLATPIFNVGDGWMAWILLPVNSVAGLLVISAKVVRMAWKRVFGLRTLF